MQRLYSGSGTWGYEVLGERYDAQDWSRLRSVLRQLLEKRQEDPALKLLDRFNWKVVEGTNDFADEFGMLFARVPLSLYAENGHLPSSPAARQAAKVLAETLTEIEPDRPHIRHVGYLLESAAPATVVAVPQLSASRAVQVALGDADRLLEGGGAVSAVEGGTCQRFETPGRMSLLTAVL